MSVSGTKGATHGSTFYYKRLSNKAVYTLSTDLNLFWLLADWENPVELKQVVYEDPTLRRPSCIGNRHDA